MISWLKDLFSSKVCGICNKKQGDMRKYFDDRGKRILVCKMCVDYVERRAYRKRS